MPPYTGTVTLPSVTPRCSSRRPGRARTAFPALFPLCRPIAGSANPGPDQLVRSACFSVRTTEKRVHKLAATPNAEFVKDGTEVLLNSVSRDVELVDDGLRREPAQDEHSDPILRRGEAVRIQDQGTHLVGRCWFENDCGLPPSTPIQARCVEDEPSTCACLQPNTCRLALRRGLNTLEVRGRGIEGHRQFCSGRTCALTHLVDPAFCFWIHRNQRQVVVQHHNPGASCISATTRAVDHH